MKARKQFIRIHSDRMQFLRARFRKLLIEKLDRRDFPGSILPLPPLLMGWQFLSEEDAWSESTGEPLAESAMTQQPPSDNLDLLPSNPIDDPNSVLGLDANNLLAETLGDPILVSANQDLVSGLLNESAASNSVPNAFSIGDTDLAIGWNGADAAQVGGTTEIGVASQDTGGSLGSSLDSPLRSKVDDSGGGGGGSPKKAPRGLMSKSGDVSVPIGQAIAQMLSDTQAMATQANRSLSPASISITGVSIDGSEALPGVAEATNELKGDEIGSGGPALARSLMGGNGNSGEGSPVAALDINPKPRIAQLITHSFAVPDYMSMIPPLTLAFSQLTGHPAQWDFSTEGNYSTPEPPIMLPPVNGTDYYQIGSTAVTVEKEIEYGIFKMSSNFGNGHWEYIEYVTGSYEWNSIFLTHGLMEETLTQSGTFVYGFGSYKYSWGQGYIFVEQYSHDFARTGTSLEVDGDAWHFRQNVSVFGTDSLNHTQQAYLYSDEGGGVPFDAVYVESTGWAQGSYSSHTTEEHGSQSESGDYENAIGTQSLSKQTGTYQDSHQYELNFGDNYNEKLEAGKYAFFQASLWRHGFQNGYSKLIGGNNQGYDKEKQYNEKTFTTTDNSYDWNHSNSSQHTYSDTIEEISSLTGEKTGTVIDQGHGSSQNQNSTTSGTATRKNRIVVNDTKTGINEDDFSNTSSQYQSAYSNQHTYTSNASTTYDADALIANRSGTYSFTNVGSSSDKDWGTQDFEYKKSAPAGESYINWFRDVGNRKFNQNAGEERSSNWNSSTSNQWVAGLLTATVDSQSTDRDKQSSKVTGTETKQPKKYTGKGFPPQSDALTTTYTDYRQSDTTSTNNTDTVTVGPGGKDQTVSGTVTNQTTSPSSFTRDATAVRNSGKFNKLPEGHTGYDISTFTDTTVIDIDETTSMDFRNSVATLNASGNDTIVTQEDYQSNRVESKTSNGNSWRLQSISDADLQKKKSEQFWHTETATENTDTSYNNNLTITTSVNNAPSTTGTKVENHKKTAQTLYGGYGNKSSETLPKLGQNGTREYNSSTAYQINQSLPFSMKLEETSKVTDYYQPDGTVKRTNYEKVDAIKHSKFNDEGVLWMRETGYRSPSGQWTPDDDYLEAQLYDEIVDTRTHHKSEKEYESVFAALSAPSENKFSTGKTTLDQQTQSTSQKINKMGGYGTWLFKSEIPSQAITSDEGNYEFEIGSEYSSSNKETIIHGQNGSVHRTVNNWNEGKEASYYDITTGKLSRRNPANPDQIQDVVTDYTDKSDRWRSRRLEEIGQSKTAADGTVIEDSIASTLQIKHGGSGNYNIVTTEKLLGANEKVLESNIVKDIGTRTLSATEKHYDFTRSTLEDSQTEELWTTTTGKGEGGNSYNVSGKFEQIRTYPSVTNIAEGTVPYFKAERNYTNSSNDTFTYNSKEKVAKEVHIGEDNKEVTKYYGTLQNWGGNTLKSDNSSHGFTETGYALQASGTKGFGTWSDYQKDTVRNEFDDQYKTDSKGSFDWKVEFDPYGDVTLTMKRDGEGHTKTKANKDNYINWKDLPEDWLSAEAPWQVQYEFTRDGGSIFASTGKIDGRTHSWDRSDGEMNHEYDHDVVIHRPVGGSPEYEGTLTWTGDGKVQLESGTEQYDKSEINPLDSWNGKTISKDSSNRTWTVLDDYELTKTLAKDGGYQLDDFYERKGSGSGGGTNRVILSDFFNPNPLNKKTTTFTSQTSEVSTVNEIRDTVHKYSANGDLISKTGYLESVLQQTGSGDFDFKYDSVIQYSLNEFSETSTNRDSTGDSKLSATLRIDWSENQPTITKQSADTWSKVVHNGDGTLTKFRHENGMRVDDEIGTHKLYYERIDDRTLEDGVETYSIDGKVDDKTEQSYLGGCVVTQHEKAYDEYGHFHGSNGHPNEYIYRWIQYDNDKCSFPEYDKTMVSTQFPTPEGAVNLSPEGPGQAPDPIQYSKGKYRMIQPTLVEDVSKMGLPNIPTSLPLEGWGHSGLNDGGLNTRSGRLFLETKLEGAFQNVEMERLHRQFAADKNLADSAGPARLYVSYGATPPYDWSLISPDIKANQQPSFIESYVDLTAHTYSSGAIYRETLTKFKGPAPTDDGLPPHSSLAVGTQTVTGIQAVFAMRNEPLAISQRTKSTLMLDQADQQSKFLQHYKDAGRENPISLSVGEAIVALQQRGGKADVAEVIVGVASIFQSLTFIGVIPDETESGQQAARSVQAGGNDDTSGTSTTNGLAPENDLDSDPSGLKVANPVQPVVKPTPKPLVKSDSRPDIDAFFEEWDKQASTVGPAVVSSLAQIDPSIIKSLRQRAEEDKAWLVAHDAYLAELPNFVPDDELGSNLLRQSSATEGSSDQDDDEALVEPGEGLEAKVNLKNIDPKKLEALLKDPSIARGFARSRSWTLQETIVATQDINKAEIIVLGTEESPKIAVVKIKTPTPAPIGPYPSFVVEKTSWQGWIGQDGQLKMFADNYAPKDHIYPDATGEYAAVAATYFGRQAEINAYAFAGGLEFTLNVIPFGGAYQKLRERDEPWNFKDGAEVGVMLVTDTLTLFFPVAKAAQASGRISLKTVQTAVRVGKAVGYTTGGLEGSMVIADMLKQGVNWQNSGQLVGVLLQLLDIKLTSMDATRGASTGTRIVAENMSQVGEGAAQAGRRAENKVAGQFNTPEPITPQPAPGQPGKFRKVDPTGTNVEPDKIYDTLDDAKKAANKATLEPVRGLDYFDEIARQSTQNPGSSRVVLGKGLRNDGSLVDDKLYTRVAAHYRATYLKIENWRDLVKTLDEDELWKINEAFLDQQVRAGKEIILSHDPDVATGFFLKEVTYLEDADYTFYKDGWVWKAVLE